MSEIFGFTTTDSTSKKINVIAVPSEALSSIVGKMVSLDVAVENDLYRCLGTVTDIKTVNSSFSPQVELLSTKHPDLPKSDDLRKLEFSIQATFRKEAGSTKWTKYSSVLPTSPSTLEPVQILDEAHVKELIENEEYPTIGYFRGMGSSPQPLDIPDFGGATGSVHSAVIGKSGSGKDLALTTPIPTPTGWTTMGELKIGDKVFSETGKPIKVLHVHEILTSSVCYDVTFSDGETITAGSGHLWYTETANTENQGAFGPAHTPQITSALRKLADETPDDKLISIYELKELVKSVSKQDSDELVSSVLKETEQNEQQYNQKAMLNTIAEYGSRMVNNAEFVGSVKTTQEIVESLYDTHGWFTHSIPLASPLELPETILPMAPYALGVQVATQDGKVSTLVEIPAAYLRASARQRYDLLQGLLSVTDVPRTQSFATSTASLAETVYELVVSLGYQAYVTEINNAGTSKWVIIWSSKGTSTRRYIVSVKQVDTVPTRCITVDSETALYLAGRSFVPTHNTAMYTYMLSAAMKHEQHAIMVIDPQGQWSNENGMVISAQKFAKGLGRNVSVLRVAEDIKLPMSEDVFSRMVTTLNLWKKFRRMGTENKEAFSDAVASRIASRPSKDYDKEPRELLTKVFVDIASSQSSLDRIYTRGDRQDNFRRDLLMLAGEPIIDPETEEQEVLSAGDLEDVEQNWNVILSIFSPLINLFSSTNITGGKRTPLDGEYGFLKDVFQIRSPQSAPAPYVVLDMSPSVSLHEKAGMMRGRDDALNMQSVLDNQDVKALMILLLLDEMKKASEIAFSSGGGNLNTQIVFDEAWRYAPEGKATPIIEELASKLEGFALDTRKFGIGWTYILQSPGDLKAGIWKQLSYVYVGYGLVGDDVRKLESLTDDVRQIDLYRQFIPPKSTGIYPFMLMGSISPVIFTTAPAFVNVFNKTEDFLFYNQKWMNQIVAARSLPKITLEYLTTSTQSTPKFVNSPTGEKKSYSVGKDARIKKSEPQMVIEKPKAAPVQDDGSALLDEMPF